MSKGRRLSKGALWVERGSRRELKAVLCRPLAVRDTARRLWLMFFVCGIACAATAAVLLPVGGAATQAAAPTVVDTPAAITTLSDVRAARLASGGKTAISYQINHDVQSRIEPGEGLPGVRIDRDDYPSAYGGVTGADGGDFGAWLAPANGAFSFQFEPRTTFVENTYFTNRMQSGDPGFLPPALPLNAGDSFDLAMADSIATAHGA